MVILVFSLDVAQSTICSPTPPKKWPRRAIRATYFILVTKGPMGKQFENNIIHIFTMDT